MTYKEAQSLKIGDIVMFIFKKDCPVDWRHNEATITNIYPMTDVKKLQVAYECNGFCDVTTHDRLILKCSKT